MKTRPRTICEPARLEQLRVWLSAELEERNGLSKKVSKGDLRKRDGVRRVDIQTKCKSLGLGFKSSDVKEIVRSCTLGESSNASDTEIVTTTDVGSFLTTYAAPQPIVQQQTVGRVVDVPQVPTVEKVVAVPQVQVQEVVRHVPRVEVQEVVREVPLVQIQDVERVVEVQQLQTVENIVEEPQVQVQEVVRHVPRVEIQEVVRQVPKDQIQTVEKFVDVPQTQTVEEVVELPEVQIQKVVHGDEDKEREKVSQRAHLLSRVDELSEAMAKLKRRQVGFMESRRPCAYYNRGWCKFGDDCAYPHTEKKRDAERSRSPKHRLQRLCSEMPVLPFSLDVLPGYPVKMSSKNALKLALAGLSMGYEPKKLDEGTSGIYALYGPTKKPVAVVKPACEVHIDARMAAANLNAFDVLRNEVAASLLDHKSSAGVPQTLLVNAKWRGQHLGAAMFQLYVEDSVSLDRGGADPRILAAEEIHKIAVLDVRLGNRDRNKGNFMVGKDQTLVPIDHAYSFLPESASVLNMVWLEWPRSQLPLTARMAQYVEGLDFANDERILTALGFSSDSIAGVAARLASLKSGAKEGRSISSICHDVLTIVS